MSHLQLIRTRLSAHPSATLPPLNFLGIHLLNPTKNYFQALTAKKPPNEIVLMLFLWPSYY